MWIQLYSSWLEYVLWWQGILFASSFASAKRSCECLWGLVRAETADIVGADYSTVRQYSQEICSKSYSKPAGLPNPCRPNDQSSMDSGPSSTLNSKRKYTLWVSVCKYSKPTACRTHERVWGIAPWCSTPNKTEFVNKFQVVPKFWIRVWAYALYQPL